MVAIFYLLINHSAFLFTIFPSCLCPYVSLSFSSREWNLISMTPKVRLIFVKSLTRYNLKIKEFIWLKLFLTSVLSLILNNKQVIIYSALHLKKACLLKPLWVMQSKVVGTDFFISLHVQNISVYETTLPVLAFIYTIHSSATFTRESCEFS